VVWARATDPANRPITIDPNSAYLTDITESSSWLVPGNSTHSPAAAPAKGWEFIQYSQKPGPSSAEAIANASSVANNGKSTEQQQRKNGQCVGQCEGVKGRR
jgi:hypothetical protein